MTASPLSVTFWLARMSAVMSVTVEVPTEVPVAVSVAVPVGAAAELPEPPPPHADKPKALRLHRNRRREASSAARSGLPSASVNAADVWQGCDGRGWLEISLLLDWILVIGLSLACAGRRMAVH